MTFVWVAVRGENYEGYRILGIFTKREDAIARVMREEAYGGINDTAEWKPVPNVDYMWQSGCDYIRVTGYPLDIKHD